MTFQTLIQQYKANTSKMKKLLSILAAFVGLYSFGQVNYVGSGTTAQIDGLNVPSGRSALIYNSTLSQYGFENSASLWYWLITEADIDTFAELNAIVADQSLLYSGGDAGTPSAIVLTNATGLPQAQVTQHQSALSITKSQVSDFPVVEADLGTSVNASLDLADNSIQNNTSNVISSDFSIANGGTGFGIIPASGLFSVGAVGSITLAGGSMLFQSNSDAVVRVDFDQGVTPGANSFIVRNGSSTDVFTVDESGDIVANSFTGSVASATVDASGFSGNLATTDDTVQEIANKFDAFAGGGGGASQLSDLTDVNTSTATNRNVLVADGVDWESRALVEADISDLSHTVNTDSQTLSFTSPNLSISGGNSVDISAIQDGTGTDDQIASEVPFTPAGTIAATNVQAAIEEVAAEASGGSGDVVGPASAVDNSIARFDTTTGKLLQGSGVTIDDSNVLTVGGAGSIIVNSSVNDALRLRGSALDTRLGIDGDRYNGIIFWRDNGTDRRATYELEPYNGTTELYRLTFNNAGGNIMDWQTNYVTSHKNFNASAGVDVTGNITVTGTVDARDIAADGAKLDGIEAGATADQAGSEVPLADAGAYFTTDNVEAATQQLAADVAGKVDNTISVRTSVTTVTAIGTQTVANYLSDGVPSAGEWVGLSDATPEYLTTSATFNFALLDEYNYDDSATDAATITFSNMGEGHKVRIKYNRASAPTYSGETPTQLPNTFSAGSWPANDDVEAVYYKRFGTVYYFFKEL